MPVVCLCFPTFSSIFYSVCPITHTCSCCFVCSNLIQAFSLFLGLSYLPVIFFICQSWINFILIMICKMLMFFFILPLSYPHLLSFSILSLDIISLSWFHSLSFWFPFLIIRVSMPSFSSYDILSMFLISLNRLWDQIYSSDSTYLVDVPANSSFMPFISFSQNPLLCLLVFCYYIFETVPFIFTSY